MENKKLPILELSSDGSKHDQSTALVRMLGKKYGYYPEDLMLRY